MFLQPVDHFGGALFASVVDPFGATGAVGIFRDDDPIHPRMYLEMVIGLVAQIIMVAQIAAHDVNGIALLFDAVHCCGLMRWRLIRLAALGFAGARIEADHFDVWFAFGTGFGFGLG